MRGKAENACVTGEGNRITPAYAGKSFDTHSFGFDKQDHPRLCGEKFTSWRTTAFLPGSPPPMRGKGFCRAILW